MAFTDLNIPSNWIIGQIELKIFIKLEKQINETNTHRVRYLPIETFQANLSIHDSFDKGLTIEKLNDDEKEGNILAIQLAGEFFSVDRFRLQYLKADSSIINVLLDYIRVESLDGSPFNVNPFLLIPLNSSLYSYNKLCIAFESFERDFFTGTVKKNEHIQIAEIEIDLINKSTTPALP